MKKFLYIGMICISGIIHGYRVPQVSLEITYAAVDQFLSTFEKFPETLRVPQHRTCWKVLVYMEADNDLYPFSLKDLQEMMVVGSNDNLSILVQFDGLGDKAFTKRLLIQKGKIYELGTFDSKLDGGSAETLTDFCLWAHTEFPSENTALVLWNHGSGVLDPSRGRPFNSAELFSLNPVSNMLELDRSIGLFEYLERRGVCFNDTFGTFLSNQKLDFALNNIVKGMGKKLDVIAFDACLMSMIEIADYARFYANYMVSSEEVEPGTGWFYDKTLAPLAAGRMSPHDFACHAVESYRKGYVSNTRDFTQSALDLQQVTPLLKAVHKISSLLLTAIQAQLNGSVETAIIHALDSRHCTRFAEPSYVDLGHFLRNLQLVIPLMHVQSGQTSLLQQLNSAVSDALQLYNRAVIANVHGSSLPNATGLAIYFPSNYLGAAYQDTFFYKENNWGKLLNHFFLR